MDYWQKNKEGHGSMMGQPHAYQTLPEGYQLEQRLDLIKDRKLLLSLSLASLVLFAGCGLGLVWMMFVLRPEFAARGMSVSLAADSTGPISLRFFVLLGVIFVMVVLHEAIHGLFFRLLTGGKAKFAFKGAYAYAAAPDWYLHKGPYLVVSLAPLVLITVLGVILLVFVPDSWLVPLMLLVAMNASGAVGDLYVFFLLVRKPEDVLVRDFGEQMEIYTRQNGKSDA
jgi:hypothetical protein